MVANCTAWTRTAPHGQQMATHAHGHTRRSWKVPQRRDATLNQNEIETHRNSLEYIRTLIAVHRHPCWHMDMNCNTWVCTPANGDAVVRVWTIPVLGYWVLDDICMYWVVSVSGDIFFGRDTRYCGPLISKRRRPHDNHLNCAERSSTAEHGEGSEGVGRVQAVIHGR